MIAIEFSMNKVDYFTVRLNGTRVRRFERFRLYISVTFMMTNFWERQLERSS